MSLDIYLHAVRRTLVWEYNITHNLNAMADEAGVYRTLWRPEEMGIKKAEELIPFLEAGLERLKAEPERFRALNPRADGYSWGIFPRFQPLGSDPFSPTVANGWGTYENLVEFVEKYLEACRENPDAEVEASR